MFSRIFFAECFSTGIFFAQVYWEYYKSDEAVEQARNGRLTPSGDLGGCSIRELYVAPRFADLKAEVAASGLVPMERFQLDVVAKAKLYLQSEKCKKIGNVFVRFPPRTRCTAA